MMFIIHGACPHIYIALLCFLLKRGYYATMLEELKLPGDRRNLPNPPQESLEQNVFAQPPRMESLVEELRAGLNSGELKKAEKSRSGLETVVPNWEKIELLYRKHGFVKNTDKRGRPMMGYKADDGIALDEEVIKFWVNLKEPNKTVLERAAQYHNTVESARQLLEAEDIYGDARLLLDEIFRRIGASKRVQEGETVYIFSDGEMSLYTMTEFLRMKAQSEGIRQHNEAAAGERMGEDHLKRAATDFWKKYD